MSALAAVVLAAGEGRRLRPLSAIKPKALCPVNNVPLVEHALQRIAAVGPIAPSSVAVNAHHLAGQLVEQIGGRAHLSLERPVALGTAGAIGALRPWIDGRDVLIANADAWLEPQGLDLPAFVAGWDRQQPRLLVVEDAEEADFVQPNGRWRFAGVSALPWSLAVGLVAEPSGLYEAVWSRMHVDLVPTSTTAIDCGTPVDYLRANLLASGGESVIGAGARVEGEVVRSVVWPGGAVPRGERLVESIRVGADLTVPAPQPARN